MIHVQSQKIRRAFYVAGILTGMFMTAGTSADAANLMITIPSKLFYADITRSFGGDYEMQWKLNAGIRYAF